MHINTTSPVVEPLEPRQLLSTVLPEQAPPGISLRDGGPELHIPIADTEPMAVAGAAPRSGAVPLAVSFSAAGSFPPAGEGVRHRWFFGDGSDPVEGFTAQHTFTQRGAFQVRLVVLDGEGGRAVDRVTIRAGDLPPNVQIHLPAAGSTYRGGQQIRLSGVAIDREDGRLPDESHRWRIVSHVGDTRRVIANIPADRTPTFTVPRNLGADPDQFIRATLIARDSAGGVGRQSVDLFPTLTSVRLATSFDGLRLRVDGDLVATPVTFPAVVGMRMRLNAPAMQTLGASAFQFRQWSHGGPARQVVEVPFTQPTYFAVYQLTLVPGILPRDSIFSAAPIDIMPRPINIMPPPLDIMPPPINLFGDLPIISLR